MQLTEDLESLLLPWILLHIIEALRRLFVPASSAPSSSADQRERLTIFTAPCNLPIAVLTNSTSSSGYQSLPILRGSTCTGQETPWEKRGVVDAGAAGELVEREVDRGEEVL
jgi:hypothetical protein